MPLETINYIPDLNPANPTTGDGLNQGDDHLRGIKAALKNTFPNFTDVGLAATQAQIDAVATAAYPFVTASLAANAVTTAQITDANVTTAKIADLNVTTGKLADGAVTTVKLGDAQVTTAKIADDAVDFSKLLNATGAGIIGAAGAGPYALVTLGSGLGFSGGSLVNTGAAAACVVGLRMNNNGASPNTKYDVSAKTATLTDSAFANPQTRGAFACTIDFATTGANGCDVGTRAANKGYKIFLITDGTNNAAIATLDTNSWPTLPGGYTAAKYVGWVPTDGSSNLYSVIQVDDEAKYVGLRQIAAGAEGTWDVTAPTWGSAHNLATGYMPATAKEIFVTAVNGTGSSVCSFAAAPSNTYTGPGGSKPPPMSFVPSIAGQTISMSIWMMLETVNVYFVSQVGNFTAYLGGWKDQI